MHYPVGDTGSDDGGVDRDATSWASDVAGNGDAATAALLEDDHRPPTPGTLPSDLAERSRRSGGSAGTRATIALGFVLVLVVVAAAAGWWRQDQQLSELRIRVAEQATALAEQDTVLAEQGAELDSRAVDQSDLTAGIDANGSGVSEVQAEVDAQVEELEALRSDLDIAFIYLDDLALREQTVERIVLRDPDFVAVEGLLEDSVVQIQTDAASGSGFRLDIASGCFDLPECGVFDAAGYDTTIVTNWHVVEEVTWLDYEDRVVTVVGPDGSEAEGRVWAWDEGADLALIDIDRSDLDRFLAPLVWAPPGSAEAGDPVATGGYPLGQDLIMTTGILIRHRADTWESDAIVSAGSSGGPLVDAFGRVVGVVTSASGGITTAVEVDSLCDVLLDC